VGPSASFMAADQGLRTANVMFTQHVLGRLGISNWALIWGHYQFAYELVSGLMCIPESDSLPVRDIVSCYFPYCL